MTAVICNFQGEAYLDDCLSALLGMEGGGPDEVLVVDDGSTDASARIVRERFPGCRLLELGENRGPCAVRNAGLAAAANRAVLLVDNDVVLRPDVLARLREAFAGRPDAVAAMPRSVVHDDPDTVHYDAARLHYAGVMSLRNFYVPLGEAEGEGVVDVDGLVALTALCDRDALLAAGGFDERLFYLMEDYDLALRLRIAGHALIAVEDAIVLHKGGTAGLSFRQAVYPRRRAYYHARNRWLILAKSYRVRTLLLASPALLLYDLVWLAFAVAKGHLGPTLAGKLDALRELGRLGEARRAVQRSRVLADRELLVGGPLTLTPQLVAKPAARRLAGLLDRTLAAWWRLVRPLCG